MPRNITVNIKSNPFIYQNLIRMNNPNNLSQNNINNNIQPITAANKYIVSNLRFQKVRPIIRSNSANQHTLFGPKILKQNGPSYKLSIYKRKLK